MPRPRFTIRRLMLLTALLAVTIRLALHQPTADEAEFLGILLGAVGLTILFVSFYFALWFGALGILRVVVRRPDTTRMAHRDHPTV